MRGPSKLLSASVVYFVGNIFDKAIAFVTIPIFTRLLSTADYGITTTYLSWVSILSVVITLSLGNSIRTAIIDFNNNITAYVSSVFFLGTLSSFVVGFILIMFSLIVGTDIPFALVPICCIHSYSTSIISAIQLKYLMELQYFKRTLLLSLPNVIIVVLSILFIKSKETDLYLGRINAYALVTSVVALAYVIYYFFKGKTFYHKQYWKYALSFSIPIIFHALSNVILSQADRSMITWMRSPDETGLYGLAYQFGLVPLVFCTTLENVWIPWFTKKMQSNDYNEVNQLAKPYIFIIAMICVAIMFVAPEVLKYLSTPDYYNAVYMIAPVIMATFFMFLASLSLDLEYYLKKTKTIASNTLTAAVINIILNLFFIPKYGGVAAAYTTVFSYCLSFILHWLYTHKLFASLFPFKIYWLPILVVLSASVFANMLMDFPILRWGLAFVFVIVLFLLLRHDGFLQIIRNKGVSE